MKRFFTFVLGMFFGTVVGGIAALLSTPYTGVEARNRLKEKSMELRKTADEKIEQGQSIVQERLTTINEKIAHGLEVSSEKLQETAEKMRQSRSEISDVVDDIA
jgi:gas vesicle protein